MNDMAIKNIQIFLRLWFDHRMAWSETRWRAQPLNRTLRCQITWRSALYAEIEQSVTRQVDPPPFRHLISLCGKQWTVMELVKPTKRSKTFSSHLGHWGGGGGSSVNFIWLNCVNVMTFDRVVDLIFLLETCFLERRNTSMEAEYEAAGGRLIPLKCTKRRIERAAQKKNVPDLPLPRNRGNLTP